MATFLSRIGRFLTHPITRTGLRATRAGLLAGTIGFAGYSTGVHDALADPEGKTKQILTKVLTSRGGGATLDPSAPDALLVTRLGNEMVVAAQAVLMQQIDELDPKDSGSESERLRLESKLRVLQRQWRFVVIDNDTINAFVTDVLPGFVFIHRGLIDLLRGSPPQLAFILGHELSHQLLEHNEKAQTLQAGLSLLQLLVLAAVDPTGLVSLALEVGALGSLLSLTLALPSSRAHESEADAFSLQLVVRACRSPTEAVRVQETLGAYEERVGGLAPGMALIASHPETQQRLVNLQALLPEAEALYRKHGCDSRKTQLLRALKG